MNTIMRNFLAKSALVISVVALLMVFIPSNPVVVQGQPQRPATAVDVINPLPLPVTLQGTGTIAGNVNAAQSGQWVVGASQVGTWAVDINGIPTVMPSNTPETPLYVESKQLITTSVRAVILRGERAVLAEAPTPQCNSGTEFLITAVNVGPEILIGNNQTDVVDLPSWGVSVPVYQVYGTSGAIKVPLNILGHGPEHLSATIPGGGLAALYGAQATIAILGGMSAPKRFEFNVHFTGYCGEPFAGPFNE